MINNDIHKRQRHLPHWTSDGAIYFVTYRLIHGTLNPPERAIVLSHLVSGHPKFYHLFAAVVMPDHAHQLLRPSPGYDLSRITKGIKGVSSYLLNQHWNRSGAVWQNESFDRIIRDQNEFDVKLDYMLNNPVKWNLVSDGWNYDGWYCNPDLHDLL
jgi:hypothetical protein